MGFLGFDWGSSKTKNRNATPEFVKSPEYAESDQARKDIFAKLQQFGADPNYGAVTPDWENIWSTAQNRVKQYFWGSPTDPGVAGKIKSSAARRGVSESPALTAAMTKLGATEANTLGEMATQQGIQKTNLAESGRQSWLQTMMAMANMKPGGTFYTPWSTSKTNQLGIQGQFGKSGNSGATDTESIMNFLKTLMTPGGA